MRRVKWHKNFNFSGALLFAVDTFYRPQLAISKLVQYLKGNSSRILLQEYPSLRKQFWGRHLWSRGYIAVSSGNITDEVIQKYIEDQEGEPVEIGQFQIDSTL